MPLFCRILIFCFRPVSRQGGVIAQEQVRGQGGIQILVAEGGAGGFPEVKAVTPVRFYFYLFSQKEDNSVSLAVSKFYFMVPAERL